jgi:hypothetical protein
MPKPVFGRKTKRPTRSWLEERVARWLGTSGFEQPIRELRFAPPRLWRFDFAWPARGLALECEGGIWTHGGHTRGSGFVADVEKYNAATLLGWRVFRVTEREIRSGEAFELLERMLSREIRYVPSVLVPLEDECQR